MNTTNLLESKLFKGIILGITSLIILVFIFGLGVFVGMKRANFSFQWAEEYHRNFGGPQGGVLGNFVGTDKQFSNANGSYGQILKIDPSTSTGQAILTVKDNDGDNTEKNILANDRTIIIYQKKNIKLSDLKVDDNVTIIGDPNNNGQITARLIRVMSIPPNNLPTK